MPISEQQIVDSLRALPANRWDDVLNFIRSLDHESPCDALLCIRTAAELVTSGLFGHWASRTDLGETREYARQLRQAAERRSNSKC